LIGKTAGRVDAHKDRGAFACDPLITSVAFRGNNRMSDRQSDGSDKACAAEYQNI
jgi:hypothetical protein